MTLISMSPKPISKLKQSTMEDVQIDNILVEKKSITQTQKLINGFNQAFDLYAKAFVAPISRTISGRHTHHFKIKNISKTKYQQHCLERETIAQIYNQSYYLSLFCFVISLSMAGHLLSQIDDLTALMTCVLMLLLVLLLDIGLTEWKITKLPSVINGEIKTEEVRMYLKISTNIISSLFDPELYEHTQERYSNIHASIYEHIKDQNFKKCHVSKYILPNGIEQIMMLNDWYIQTNNHHPRLHQLCQNITIKINSKIDFIVENLLEHYYTNNVSVEKKIEQQIINLQSKLMQHFSNELDFLQTEKLLAYYNKMLSAGLSNEQIALRMNAMLDNCFTKYDLATKIFEKQQDIAKIHLANPNLRIENNIEVNGKPLYMIGKNEIFSKLLNKSNQELQSILEQQNLNENALAQHIVTNIEQNLLYI